MAIFNLAQVLTVMHPRMLCQMGEVYQILNFMTDEDLCTHQIPRALRACEPAIKGQFPALATDGMRDAIVSMCEGLDGIEDNNERRAVIDRWLREQEAIHGTEFDVQPLGYRESNPKDPLAELVEMVGPSRVAVFPVGREEGE